MSSLAFWRNSLVASVDIPFAAIVFNPLAIFIGFLDEH
jgi:hypothetical protein